MKENITKAARRVWKNFRKGVRQMVRSIKPSKQSDVRCYTRLAHNPVNYIRPDFDVLYGVLVHEEEVEPFRGFMAALGDPFPPGGVKNAARIILDPMEFENDLEEIWCQESDTEPLKMYFEDIPLY